MNAKQQIQQALEGVMGNSEANACHVFKGWHFTSFWWGWHYTKFNGPTTYLGRSLQAALDRIDAMASAQEDY